MELDPRVARMQQRMLTAPYEICLARAAHFTAAYRATEGLDPALRNARALARTLARQGIEIRPDERLAGSKTERFLAGPLSVERGDFLRSLQLELEILEKKHRPFHIAPEDRARFRREILPWWSGRTVRDAKARAWQRQGLIDTEGGLRAGLRRQLRALRFLDHLGSQNLRLLAGANLGGPLTAARLRDLAALRHEWARNNPSAAVYCFDVQGHLCLGIEKVVREGLQAICDRAWQRRAQLRAESPADRHAADFLQAVCESLEAAMAYAERFAALAARQASAATGPERERLERIASACRRVPRLPPRDFHEALQSAWMAHVVGEIQYGTHDVFAPGRADQFLFAAFQADQAAGRLDRGRAIALLQEYMLKLSANVEPIPEAGMETNGVLGNSQHCVTIGGLDRHGRDATNALSWLFLDAFEGMGGAVNQLCVRLHRDTPRAFLLRAVQVFQRCNGIAFYNDEAVIRGLVADGMALGEARDYCIVGCVETCGHADSHPCPGAMSWSCRRC